MIRAFACFTSILMTAGAQEQDPAARLAAVRVLSQRAARGDVAAARKLIESFSDASATVRRVAARGAASSGAPIVGSLLAALRDSEPRVQNTAALALSRVGKVALFLLLRERETDDADYLQRLDWVLRRQREDAIPDIVLALKADESHIVVGALHAVAGLGGAARELVADVLPFAGRSDLEIRAAALATLGSLGDVRPSVVDVLCKGLDGDRACRERSIASLVRLGPRVADTLVDRILRVDRIAPFALLVRTRATSTVDAAVRDLSLRQNVGRLLAADVLARFGAPVLPAVKRLLADSDAEVRAAGCFVAGRIGRGMEELVPTLVRLTGDSEEDVVASWSIWALGRIAARPGISLPALAARMSADDPILRAWAVESIGAFGPRATGYLAGVLAASEPDEVELVRAMALRALPAIAPRSNAVVQALIESLVDDRAFIQRAARANLDRMTDTLVPTLRKMLENPRAETRLGAVRALGHIAATPTELVPPLAALLLDPDPKVRSNAVYALARLGVQGKAAVPLITPLLDSKEVDTRHAAAYILGEIGPGAARAIPQLEKRLKDEDASVRSVAVVALRQIRPQRASSLGSLVEGLGSPVPEVRVDAARAIGRLGRRAERAAPRLVQSLRDADSEVRRMATWALGMLRVGDEATIAALVKRLGDPHGGVRMYAALALGRIGEPAVPALLAALKGKRQLVRVWAVQALEKIGPAAKAAIPELERAQKSKDPQLKNAAEWALAAVRRVH